MQKFACKDMGMNCDYVTTGNTVEEVKKKALEHAQRVHADVFKSLTTPAQIAEMDKTLMKAIRTV